MFRRIPVTATLVASIGSACAAGAAAQTAATPVPVTTRASAAVGHVEGLVRDDSGGPIGGASVLAMGSTIASVRSDARGRFALALPPGDYILRATRTGYISTVRLPVRVQTAVRLERNITLTRQEAAPLMAQADDSHAHTELAWRLRHLTRSVLRDGAERVPGDAATADEAVPLRPSFLQRTLGRSTRLASAFFADTDFTGQVNLLATGFSASATGWLPEEWPRRVAYLAVGAPVGAFGDWRVRGAIASGPLSSWVLVGDYESRSVATHAFTFGVSFGSQGPRDATASTRWPAATLYARSVAGVYGRDRWTISSAVRLDYGLRLDRYDYLESPELLSGEGRLRARVLPRTFVVAGAARRMVAPGADEFLPPAAGPWLPPERTFSALRRGEPLRAEETRRGDIGVAREFGAGARTAAIEIRRFRETSADQMATVFGFDDTRGLGHYAVGSAGRVDVSGWTASLQGRLGGRLDGRLEYTVAEAEWTDDAAARGLARAVPVAAGMPSGRVHDLAATVDADLQATATRITVMIRANTAFLVEPSPSAGRRFDVRIRQALPYQPFGGQRLEFVFAARTLFRDLAATGAFYDELLAMSPPLRFMAGVQVRF